MARIYAGILGPLAVVVWLVRGFIHAADVQALFFGAWCSLLVFAALGWVIGWIADRTVQQSVGATIQAELAPRQTHKQPQAT